jgi:hypothetical protein
VESKRVNRNFFENYNWEKLNFLNIKTETLIKI